MPTKHLTTERKPHTCTPPRRKRWRKSRRVIPMLGLLGLLGADISQGDPPEIQARQVGSYGPTSRQVTEPAVAAGPDSVLAAFFDRPNRLQHDAWYAAYNKHTDRWASGEIDPNTTHAAICDLSTAYDAQTGDFLAAATTGGAVISCRFEAGPKLGEVTPGTWQQAAHHGGIFVDKPWIVAGDPNLPTGQEYYITYSVGNYYYWYLRSINGGQNWYKAKVELADTGEQVHGGAPALQPAVDGDGPLYAAYISGGIHFLVGVDTPTSSPPAVDFWELLRQADDPNDPPVPLTVPLNKGYIGAYIPSVFSQPTASTQPQLAVDPTNPNRLYIVYQDTATNQSNDQDVNVYLRELTKNGDYWERGDRIQVNDDETLYESDQFMPSVTVDDNGRIHVIFYDDRNYTDGPTGDLQPDDDPNVLAKLDAYYAWSDDQGANWTNMELYAEPPEPAINREILLNVNPREYNGIAWYRDGLATEVWTAFSGTYRLDPSPNDSVIWSSQINWTGP